VVNKEFILNTDIHLAVAVAIGFIFLPLPASAQVDLDNGIVGDGSWLVTSEDAGSSSNGVIDPTGALGPTDVIFYFSPYYDNGMDGADGELLDNVTTPAALTGANQATSSGTFPGPNGSISWTAVATIAPGSPLYVVQYDFSSSLPFGNTRIINYFDEDVAGSGSDIVVVFGTPGADDFQLLTVDDSVDVGVSLSAAYSSAINMTYAGWAIDDCCQTPSVFSIAGDLGSLLPHVDARYPTNAVYGPPQDVTTSLAFDFNPAATTASVTLALGGSPDATPPPPPGPTVPPGPATPVPLLGSWSLGVLMVLIPVIVGLTRRRKKLTKTQL
jgi:hypothetical protein